MAIPAPYPEQLAIITSPARFNVVAAGRSYGKSTVVAPLWLAYRITGPGVRDKRAWVAAQTFTGCKDIYWDMLKELFEPALAEKPRESELMLRLINGSTVKLVGMDRLPARRGARLDALVLDEAAFLKQGDMWATVRPMLTKGGQQGQALFLSSPQGANEFYDLFRKGDPTDEKYDRAWKSWKLKTAEAPHIPREEIEAARRDMDPDTFAQEMEAEFIKRGGAVYNVFDRHVHVRPTVYDPRFQVVIGEDFNISCQVSVLCQIIPEGMCRQHDTCRASGRETLHVFAEVISKDTWTQDHAAKMAHVVEKLGARPQQSPVYCDASGKNRQRTSISDVEAVQSRGFPVYHPTANPHVEDQYNAVRAMLKAADGTVRMQIDPSCRQTSESLEKWSYRPGTNPPEADRTKGHDHACNAVGYLVHYRWPPGGAVRGFRRR